jgi:hypothetical protein
MPKCKIAMRKPAPNPSPKTLTPLYFRPSIYFFNQFHGIDGFG